jgi:hypothetical protein
MLQLAHLHDLADLKAACYDYAKKKEEAVSWP